MIAFTNFLYSAFFANLYSEDILSLIIKFCIPIGILAISFFLYARVFENVQGINAVLQTILHILSLIYGIILWNNNHDDSLEEENSMEDPPAVLEQPKKLNRKSKKKKRNKCKNMDDPNFGSSKQKIETYSTHEKTKVYTPLNLYVKLNIKLYDLYYEFKPHVLSEEQLCRNGFPRDSPNNPGRVTLNPKIPDIPNQRHCVRCGLHFFVMDDGKYESNSSCRFHLKKLRPCNNIPGKLGYECCNGDYKAEGCTTWNFHVSAEYFINNIEFVKAREKRHLSARQSCTVYALDCEMCYTTGGMEVTKIGIVGVDGLTVYESFILPEKQILDYNTTYSGVTANDLKGVSTTLTDVQTFLLKLLNRDSVLVGHGLENDLKALRLIHDKVVDTTVVFPHHHGGRYKRSLKSLASEFLSKSIQDNVNGHDCIEDARTCMELMLWKIESDLKEHPPIIQDENKNSILQNLNKSEVPACDIWGNRCLPFYSSGMYRDRDFYIGYLLPMEESSHPRVVYC